MWVFTIRVNGLLPQSLTPRPGGTGQLQTCFHHPIERQNIEASRLRGREGASTTHEERANKREERGEDDECDHSNTNAPDPIRTLKLSVLR